MAKNKPTALKNILVLFVVALVSVSLLAVLNQITKGKIEAAEIQARNEIYQSVFAEAASFETMNEQFEANDDTIVINSVLTAEDAGKQKIGYVFDVTSKNGYGGDVQIAVGVKNNGEITAFKVISASETPGLGAKSMEDEYASQFSGLSAMTPIGFSKTGADRNKNEIDAIGGATITTTATTNAVNAAIELFNSQLKGE